MIGALLSLASRYGSYEVVFKALNYPPHTFDDPKIKEEKMVVDAEDSSDAESIVKKMLKQQGRTFFHIYSVHLLEYKSKPKYETNKATVTKNESNNKKDTNIQVPKGFLYFLLGVCAVAGFIVVAMLIMIELFA